ncbi:MAG: hypothetical protein MUF23_00090, partial [Pirellula sp.]|nr:hypothetical protein [Pirellula sp.]
DDSEQFVHVWDRQTNTEVARLLGHTNGSVMTVRFSPNGKRLLTVSTVWEDSSVPGKVIEWDLAQGQPTSVVIERSAKTAAYSPDGQSIYVGSVDGSILVVDATTGEIQREWNGNGSLILCLNVSQDGKYLATSSRDGVLCIWDLVHGQRILKLQGLGDCRQVIWNRDGTRLSVCDYGGLIRHFSFDQGQLTLKDTEMRTKSPQLCYSPDGMTVASSVFSEGADIRSAETARVLQKFHSHHGHVLALAFDASGRWFLTGGADGTVCIWDVADRSPYYRERLGTVGGIATAMFRPRKAQFAVGIERLNSRGATASGKPRLELYNSQTLQLERTFLGHTDWVTCMSFDTSGDSLVSGSSDRTIRVWDVESGSQTHCLKGHDASLQGAWIQEPGESVVSVDDRGAIHRWNLSTQESIWSYQNLEESVDVQPFVAKAAYSARTDRLAIAIPSRGRIDVWDMNQLRRLGSHPLASKVHSMEFHPDGVQLAVASERSAIELWDTTTTSEYGNALPVATMTGHSDSVTSIAFSTDGERLVSVSKDETIRLFDTHRGFELMVLDELRGQNSIVAFSPDSKKILRCEGRRMSLWSTERFRKPPSNYQDQLLAWHRDGYLQANSLDDRFALEFHLTRLMELEPETASHWYHRGRVRSMHTDYEGAETDLQKALSMRDNLSVRSLLCRNYLAKGDLESLREECLSMIDRLGDSKSDADVNLVAWTCSLTPDLRMELDRFVQPMEEICNRTQRGTYWNTLSLLYYRMERMDDAIRAANESMRIDRAGNEPVDWMFRAMSMARLIRSGDPRASELSQTLDRDLHRIEEWKRMQAQSLLTGRRKEARILRIQNVELKQFAHELEQLLMGLR